MRLRVSLLSPPQYAGLPPITPFSSSFHSFRASYVSRTHILYRVLDMKSNISLLRSLIAVTLMAAILAPAVSIKADPVASKGLTEDQKILHVLNRLGFGARPGDVGKVKAMG